MDTLVYKVVIKHCGQDKIMVLMMYRFPQKCEDQPEKNCLKP